MKPNLKITEIICFFIACALGVLFHFVYRWSGYNPIIGLFFPINESTWEHLKLVFYPILIVSVVEYFGTIKQHRNFACIKLASSLLGMASVVVLFYTYSGIIGTPIDFVNLIVYFLSMAIAYIYSYRTLSAQKKCPVGTYTCIAGIFVIVLLFFIFTAWPPKIGLFAPPV